MDSFIQYGSIKNLNFSKLERSLKEAVLRDELLKVSARKLSFCFPGKKSRDTLRLFFFCFFCFPLVK